MLLAVPTNCQGCWLGNRKSVWYVKTASLVSTGFLGRCAANWSSSVHCDSLLIYVIDRDPFIESGFSFIVKPVSVFAAQMVHVSYKQTLPCSSIK